MGDGRPGRENGRRDCHGARPGSQQADSAASGVPGIEARPCGAPKLLSPGQLAGRGISAYV